MGTLAREQGLGTCYVTNGYITEEALRELAPMLSAFRVDIKSFSEDFYRKIVRRTFSRCWTRRCSPGISACISKP